MSPPQPPIRVLLVEDHEHVLWGLSKLVEGEWPRMVVAGMARTLAQALDALRAGNSDIVVMDLVVGGDDSLLRLPEMRGLGGAEFLVLTEVCDPEQHRRALRAGVRAVVHKEEPAAVLLREIERAHQCRLEPIPSQEQYGARP